MTVGRLSREMSSRELVLWMEWDRTKPNTELEHRFADLQHTIVSAVAAIVGGRAPKRDVFLPRRQEAEMTCAEMKVVFVASCAGLPRE